MDPEEYIQIRKSDFGLVQRKYQISPEENQAFSIDMIKKDIAVEIGQFLLSHGLLNFHQEGDMLTAELYVVRAHKGRDQ